MANDDTVSNTIYNEFTADLQHIDFQPAFVYRFFNGLSTRNDWLGVQQFC